MTIQQTAGVQSAGAAPSRLGFTAAQLDYAAVAMMLMAGCTVYGEYPADKQRCARVIGSVMAAAKDLGFQQNAELVALMVEPIWDGRITEMISSLITKIGGPEALFDLVEMIDMQCVGGLQ
ncbi:hypothetical protein [Massilia sp. DWR3-1-1]|uniref:hypothetical protein n=1 Tax=Massilia sp. DWR3-1-1 TaxID=2804559 RepID=UPI003CF544FD